MACSAVRIPMPTYFHRPARFVVSILDASTRPPKPSASPMSEVLAPMGEFGGIDFFLSILTYSGVILSILDLASPCQLLSPSDSSALFGPFAGHFAALSGKFANFSGQLFPAHSQSYCTVSNARHVCSPSTRPTSFQDNPTQLCRILHLSHPTSHLYHHCRPYQLS